MDQKKKKLLLILGGVLIFLILILVIVLIANGNKKSTDNTDDTDNIESVELIYWGLWEPASVMQPVIDEYEEANPGVSIIYSQSTFTGYENRLYTRLDQASSSSEPAPDIMRINNTWTPKFYKYLTPLPSSVMDRSTYDQTFYPTAIKDFTAKDGNIYAMPWEIDGLAVFYNKQILQDAGVNEPPTDWDGFIELAKELTTKNIAGQILQSGLAIGTSQNIAHSAEILSFLMLLNGANIIDDTYTSVDLTSSEVLSAVEIYTGYALGDNNVWSTDLRNDLEMFYSGKLAMMFGPSWRAFDIIQSAPNIEFGIAPLPQLSNNNPIYYSMYWGDAVSSTCQNPDIAWDFIKFLTTKQEEIFSASSQIRAFGEPYSLVELNSKLESNSYLTAYATMAPYMQSWSMGDQGYVESAINAAIKEIIQDGEDIESAFSNAQADINDQLAQSNK